MVLSAEPFSFSDTIFRNESFTIELIVRPHRDYTDGSPSILTVYDRWGQEQLIVSQWIDGLILEVPAGFRGSSGQQLKQHRKIGIDQAFPANKICFVTIASSYQETAIYLDGHLARRSPHLSLLPTSRPVWGYLVFGNLRSGKGYWNGDVLGLAIYDRHLDVREVQSHVRAWTERGRLTGGEESIAPIGLYTFSEQKGQRIANASGTLPDFVIPETFSPLKKTILHTSWPVRFFSRSNISDITVNVLGFVPFGFFFAAWVTRKGKHSKLFIWGATLIAGLTASLTIELAQVFLPMRDSSLNDVIFNVLGTVAGLVLTRK